MNTIFYGMGPAFKPNSDYPPFSNTDLYLLIAKILNLKPVHTDGQAGEINAMLKNP